MTTPQTPVPTGRAGVLLELLGLLVLLGGVVSIVVAAALTDMRLGLAIGGVAAAAAGYLLASSPTDRQ